MLMGIDRDGYVPGHSCALSGMFFCFGLELVEHASVYRSHADAGAPKHGGMTLSGETYEQIIPNGQPGSRERFPAWFDDHHT